LLNILLNVTSYVTIYLLALYAIYFIH